MKKKENLDSKLQILTLNQEIFKNSRIFSCFYHFFIIFLARGTWNSGKPWKSMKNNQKQRNMKKNEIANEKKWKFGLKVADSHSEPGNLQKLEKFSFFFYHFFIIYFSFFYHFPCPWHLKSRKTMKINENNGKQSKTKKNE